MEKRNESIFPMDIVEEILSLLPVKSLCRFQCVLKSWRALITKREFTKTHLSRTRNLQKESLLIYSESNKRLFSAAMSNNGNDLLGDMSALTRNNLTFAAEDHHLCYDIVASCDGMVLVGRKGRKILINPTTREIKELPLPLFDKPCATFLVWGLGYDVVSDDYKVAGHSYYKYPPENEDKLPPDFASVYSVKNGTWKKLKGPEKNHLPQYGIFHHGFIHWPEKVSIEALDLAEEKFCKVPPPDICTEDAGSLVLTVLGGCLCMVCSYTAARKTHVWMMKEYGIRESWTKFTIAHPGEKWVPLCSLDQEQIVLLWGKQKTDKELATYNLKEGMFTGRTAFPRNFRVIATFVESLISPYCNNEMRRHVSIEEFLLVGKVDQLYIRMDFGVPLY